jgi:hypothetical protein
MNSNRRHFASTDPYAGCAGHPIGRDREFGERINKDLLNSAHIFHYVAFPVTQVDDRVADDLAGTVIRYVASTIRCVKLDAGPPENFIGGEQILYMAISTHGDDVPMLDEEKLVGDFAALPLIDELPLHFKRFGVSEASEIADFKVTH